MTEYDNELERAMVACARPAEAVPGGSSALLDGIKHMAAG